MLFFGHTGLTLAAAASADFLYSRLKLAKNRGANGSVHPSAYTRQTFTVVDRLDVRLLLIGSLLPDIIDKPVGVFFLRNVYSSGRIFSHTLLFLLVLTVAGIIVQSRYRKLWLLTFVCGVLTHLVFDSMWRYPVTLFWPLFGFSFPEAVLDNWFGTMFYELLHVPAVYIPEILGFGVLAALLVWLARKGRLFSFIKTGRLG